MIPAAGKPHTLTLADLAALAFVVVFWLLMLFSGKPHRGRK